jgi:MtN3 and saliva related transmembrane protein
MPPPVELLGYFAAFLSTVCWIPQSIQTIRTGDTSAISLPSQSMFTFAIVLWTIYGWLIGSMPVFFCNLIAFIPVATVLWIKIRNG